jgi:hypothetical protein
MTPIDLLRWLWGDIAKDFGGPDPGKNRTLQDKRTYLAFVAVLCAVLAVGGAMVWFPWGAIPFAMICGRKVWIWATITG